MRDARLGAWALILVASIGQKLVAAIAYLTGSLRAVVFFGIAFVCL
jgi:hypothetical protein